VVEDRLEGLLDALRGQKMTPPAVRRCQQPPTEAEARVALCRGGAWTAPQGWTSCCLEKKCCRIDSSLDIPFRCNYSNNVVFYEAIHFEES
jgi:hypothetical protein